MKRKKLIFCLLLGLACIYGLFIFRLLCSHARNGQNETLARTLSIAVKLYHDTEGFYPNKLEDVLSIDGNKRPVEWVKPALELAQSNAWHDTYIYQSTTNGFKITVIGPDFAPESWIGKQRKYEHFYYADP